MGRDVYLICDKCQTRTDAFRWSAEPDRIYIESVCAMFSMHDHDCEGHMYLLEDCHFSSEQSFDYKPPPDKFWPKIKEKPKKDIPCVGDWL